MTEPRLAQLREIAAMQRPAGGWARALRADALITRDEVLGKAWPALQNLEPHGEANPRPIFAAQGAVVRRAKRVGPAEPGAEGPHLQMTLKLSHSDWPAIAFRMGERLAQVPVGAKIDVMFQLDMNEYNGNKNLQLHIIDFRPSS